MAYIVAGLVKDAHQARGLVRALTDAAFERGEIDMAGGPVSGLTGLGIPEGEAQVFAEGIRRGCYRGPERRHMAKPYKGFERRAA